MVTYLITGVNGFVGTKLLDLLSINQKNTDTIYGISRNLDTNLLNKYPAIKLEVCDLQNYTSVANIIDKIRPDYIFHFASDSSVAASWESPLKIINNNINSQVNLCEAVRKHDVASRIIVACSSEEYGLVDMKELPVNENCSFHPLSSYAVSKVSQDMLSYQYHKNYDMDIIRVRCFNLSGPGQAPKYALSSFAKQIVDIEKGVTKKNIISVGNLNVERDYTDVRDAVRAYYEIALHAKAGSVYNLCSGIPYNMNELLYMLLNLSKNEISIEIDNARMRPSDIPVMVGDNSKIKTEIGWTPKIEIRKTLMDLIEYWRSLEGNETN